MKGTSLCMRGVALLIALLCLFSLPVTTKAQEGGAQKLSKGELAQLLAPIALYPDELVSQILMASTYPLEVVQADRWAKSHKQSAGDVLAKQLEKEPWDPSVKSLVNFPEVLAKMSEKLDLTTKIGDAFLSQQKDVLDTIQELRQKAYEAGNLKSSKEQKVVVEKETIIIQPANPQVVYVPSYSTTVVYGAWPYPAYPPYYYYPPPPPAYPAYHFAAGVAVGMAWGYAWGHCNWNSGHVDYNVNQNININNNINRNKYQGNRGQGGQGGQGGRWQHNPEHRKGVAYSDRKTAQQYGQSPARSTEARRDARGYGGGAGARPSTADRGALGSRPGAGQSPGAGARPGATPGSGARPSASTRPTTGSAAGAAGAGRGGGYAGGRDTAFSGDFGSGNAARSASQRGSASRASGGFGGGGGYGGGGFGGGRSGGFGGGGGRRR
ncbi:DUF3300 domain-containing protein [Geomonas sp.]|uniref:DUF3300 domain-containing protein n=1 Tax=Geomonas sp. TaxID=2651584 RepID=UPI002B479B2B|nr:DUF3300 domain-containing protein [Geomonas sp.]HJV35889.1 DUF3300 domain-containing protein [Geomonas sp.]